MEGKSSQDLASLLVRTTQLPSSLEAAVAAEEQQQLCGEYETYTLARFIFITLGSGIALLGLVANLALFLLFTYSSHHSSFSASTFAAQVSQKATAASHQIPSRWKHEHPQLISQQPGRTPSSKKLGVFIGPKRQPPKSSSVPVKVGKKRSRRKTAHLPTLYPRVLALLDATICAVYILLFGADAAVVYLRWRQLFILYYAYIVEAFVVARIAQLAIPYMLILATLERLAWLDVANGRGGVDSSGGGSRRTNAASSKELDSGRRGDHQPCRRSSSIQHRLTLLGRLLTTRRGRYTSVALSLAICVALRLPTYWATAVFDYPQCEDFFRSRIASAAPWVWENTLYHVYDFHLLSIAQTVVPFFVLLFSNVVIVRRIIGGVTANAEKGNGSANPAKATTTTTAGASSPMLEVIPPTTPRSCSMFTIPQHQSVDVDNDVKKGSTSSVAQATMAAALVAAPRSLPSSAKSSTFSICHVRKLSFIVSSTVRMNASVRSAIYTMVAIVASYLLSNSLHLVLTMLESDPTLASTFHTVFSDVVSFVYMFTSAVRCVIYYSCNPSIRRDFHRDVNRLLACPAAACCCCWRSRRGRPHSQQLCKSGGSANHGGDGYERVAENGGYHNHCNQKQQAIITTMDSTSLRLLAATKTRRNGQREDLLRTTITTQHRQHSRSGGKGSKEGNIPLVNKMVANSKGSPSMEEKHFDDAETNRADDRTNIIPARNIADNNILPPPPPQEPSTTISTTSSTSVTLKEASTTVFL